MQYYFNFIALLHYFFANNTPQNVTYRPKLNTKKTATPQGSRRI